MTSNVLASFLGGLQASVSVLLTILYGVVGAQFDLLDDRSARRVSAICVKLFLPSLLLINIGSELDLDSGRRYLPIIIWGIIYNGLSLAFAVSARRMFKLPLWVTPAITFNNTTAMPLLLIQSLGETSIFQSILWGPDDSVPKALARMKSYFLVNSMISDSFTFGLGPVLLRESGTPPNKDLGEDGALDPALTTSYGTEVVHSGDTETRTTETEIEEERNRAEEEAILANEETSLLPDVVVRTGTSASHMIHWHGKKYYDMLPRAIRFVLSACFHFISAPLVGAAIGVVIGIIPPLKKLFFDQPENGGYFKAWLTNAVKNCGELFATLQVVVVGVKLDQSLLAMKKGQNSGSVTLGSTIFVLFVRFICWPAISIPVIWALASRTTVLSEDPMLIFALMIMPTGPTALKLQALTDVVGSTEDEKMAMAKFLTLSYAVCPLMSFAVVGALKATQAVL